MNDEQVIYSSSEVKATSSSIVKNQKGVDLGSKKT
jgi:hypothetical protein